MLRKKNLPFVMVMLLAFALFGCSSDDSTSPVTERPFDPTPPVNPQPVGDRTFGMAMSSSSAGFEASFQVAQEAGVQVAEVPLFWGQVETSEGVYQDPDGILASLIFFALNDIQVVVGFPVINTVVQETPAYLDQYNWNAPEMIAAFNNMSDWVMANIPDTLEVVGVAIGNEVNYVLDGEAWTQYAEFYEAVGDHFRTQNPGIPVGVKTTVYGGLFSADEANIKALNEHSDVIMLNYYQQDSSFQVLPPIQVHNNFTQMANDFPGREIWITEVGYQSGSEHCDSSEAKQAAFYHELFTAWDLHRHQFTYLYIDWLHDQSAETIAEWEDYYGSSQPGFVEYLSTLGLRTWEHEDKDAWLQLLAETGARGWGPPQQ